MPPSFLRSLPLLRSKRGTRQAQRDAGGSQCDNLISCNMVSEQTNIFGDLPDALINELLTRSSGISELAQSRVTEQIDRRDDLRARALRLGLISQLDNLSDMLGKSIVAVDRSAAVVRLASFEVAAATALAVDGLGWKSTDTQLPYEFDVLITDPIAHAAEIAYGLMFCMEYQVASAADRDLVMLDGAFSTGMVAISLALRSSAELRDDLSEAFKHRWTEFAMDAVPEILASDNIIALPKRSASNEFVTQTQLFGGREVDTNGRSTASLILNAGEFAGPFRLETHFFYLDPTEFYRNYINDLRTQYSEIRLVYYKPKDWTHALRIEMPPGIANDPKRLHETLETVRRQTANPAMLEPYPLYVADRFAKSLSKGINALLESVRRDVIADSSDPELASSMLNAYRTEPMVEEVEE